MESDCFERYVSRDYRVVASKYTARGGRWLRIGRLSNRIAGNFVDRLSISEFLIWFSFDVGIVISLPRRGADCHCDVFGLILRTKSHSFFVWSRVVLRSLVMGAGQTCVPSKKKLLWWLCKGTRSSAGRDVIRRNFCGYHFSWRHWSHPRREKLMGSENFS